MSTLESQKKKEEVKKPKAITDSQLLQFGVAYSDLKKEKHSSMKSKRSQSFEDSDYEGLPQSLHKRVKIANE